MDQIKIGSFLKDLRKEKGITQEQLAEELHVNNRTVSRWENARTMPDFDIMIELAKYYDVSIEELLNGERTEQMMQAQTEKTLYEIADYTNAEKERQLRLQHRLAWVGVIAWIIFLTLEILDLADTGMTEVIASFAAGSAFGMSIITVIYTSRYMSRFRAFKIRFREKYLSHQE